MRQLTQTEGDPGATSPAWSPDGTRIAFLIHNETRVWSLDPSTGNQSLVYDCTEGEAKRPCPGYGDLSWSPEGDVLVFGAYVLPLDGSRLRPFGRELREPCCAVWQSGGTRITEYPYE